MFDKLKNRTRQAAAGATIKAVMKAEGITGTPGELDDFKRSATEIGADGFTRYDRAQTDASGAVNLVVALVVGALMAAFLLPIAIDELVDVDTDGWSDGAAALWDILPVMVVLAVFLFFVGVALRRSGRI